MKIGKIQKIDYTSVTSSVSVVAGFDAQNALDENTLKLWKVKQGAVELGIVTEAFTADAICLFNCNIDTQVTISTWTSAPAMIESKVITVAEMVGDESKNVLFELTNTTTPIEMILLTFTATDSNFFTSVGYIWAGDIIDFGCCENIQPFDESNDDITITRANTVDFNTRYNYQQFSVTTKKETEYSTLRANIRTILDSGVGQKRPFIFDEVIFANDELMMGIISGSKFGYDIVDFGNAATATMIEKSAQLSMKIREVF